MAESNNCDKALWGSEAAPSGLVDIGKMYQFNWSWSRVWCSIELLLVCGVVVLWYCNRKCMVR